MLAVKDHSVMGLTDKSHAFSIDGKHVFSMTSRYSCTMIDFVFFFFLLLIFCVYMSVQSATVNVVYVFDSRPLSVDSNAYRQPGFLRDSCWPDDV